MKKVVYTASCIAFVLALPGCWSCSKEEKKTEQPVKQEQAAPAPTVSTEQTAPAAPAEGQKPTETQTTPAPVAPESPAKM